MNYAQYFAIEKKLKNQGFDFERAELIGQFTEGKKSSLKELSSWEYQEFLKMLNLRFSSAPKVSQTDEAMQIQRRKIIALFRKMGYEKDFKADMPRIYSWVIKYGYLHKSMNQYTADELPKLVTQAESAYKSYINTK